MDPNAALDRFLDAVCNGHVQWSASPFDEATEAARDLIGWIASGGFRPTDPRKRP